MSRQPAVVDSGLALGWLTAMTSFGLSAPSIILGELAADLDVETSATAWVLAASALGLAITKPLFGRAADLVGLRMTLAAGMLLLAVGALGSALAPSFGVLLVARAVQGAGAAGIALCAFVTANTRFDDQDRPRVLGILTALSSLALGGGPLLGAAVASAGSWRWVFLLPVLALAGWPMAHRLAPAHEEPQAGRLDVGGAILTMTVAAALTALLQARATSLSLPVAVLVACAGGLATWRLTVHIRRRPEGFLPRALLTNRAFVMLSCAGALLFGNLLATAFAIPLLLETGTDHGDVAIGLILMPAAIAAALTAHAIGSLVPGTDPLRALALASAATAAAILIGALGADSTLCLMIAATGGVCGFAAAQVTILGIIATLVETSIHGIAISIFDLAFVTGGAVGAAAAAAVADAASLGLALGVLTLAPLGAAWLATATGAILRTQRPSGAPA